MQELMKKYRKMPASRISLFVSYVHITIVKKTIMCSKKYIMYERRIINDTSVMRLKNKVAWEL